MSQSASTEVTDSTLSTADHPAATSADNLPSFPFASSDIAAGRLPCPRPDCKSTRGFVSQATLNAHIKTIHDKVEEYDCEISGCAKSFFNTERRGTHYRRAHKEHTFRCSLHTCKTAGTTLWAGIEKHMCEKHGGCTDTLILPTESSPWYTVGSPPDRGQTRSTRGWRSEKRAVRSVDSTPSSSAVPSLTSTPSPAASLDLSSAPSPAYLNVATQQWQPSVEGLDLLFSPVMKAIPDSSSTFLRPQAHHPEHPVQHAAPRHLYAGDVPLMPSRPSAVPTFRPPLSEEALDSGLDYASYVTTQSSIPPSPPYPRRHRAHQRDQRLAGAGPLVPNTSLGSASQSNPLEGNFGLAFEHYNHPSSHTASSYASHPTQDFQFTIPYAPYPDFASLAPATSSGHLMANAPSNMDASSYHAPDQSWAQHTHSLVPYPAESYLPAHLHDNAAQENLVHSQITNGIPDHLVEPLENLGGRGLSNEIQQEQETPAQAFMKHFLQTMEAVNP